MIRHFLAILFLVDASIAVAFLLFRELLLLCNQFHISPWWTAVLYVGAFVVFAWKATREVPSFPFTEDRS